MATPEQKQANIQNLLKELGKDEPAYIKIAEGLTNQGVASLKDIGVRQVPKYAYEDVARYYTEDGYILQGVDSGKVYQANDPNLSITQTNGADGERRDYYQAKSQVGSDAQFYNKTTDKPITSRRFGMLGNGEGGISGGDLFFNLTTDASGNVSIGQEFSPRAGGVFKEIAPLIGVGLLLIPGLGQAIGASILGGSAAAVASAVGLSVTAVTTAVGAATLSAGMTALQGGSVEDVIKAGLSAGAASGVNFAAGGGVAGAAAGSAVGTAIQGGDVSQIVTNAFAAGVGAGVQGVMTENPDAGKIIGSAARTYIATGGDLDETLLNTAATAIGTLDQPDKSAQQLQSVSAPAKVSQDLIQPFEEGGLRYEEQPDGTAKVTDQFGNETIISSSDFSKILNAPFEAPAADPSAGGTELASQTVTAPSPVVSPVVTDLDLINQVAAQPTPTIDPQVLERVIVQGQGANVANVAPVETTVTTPVQQEVPGGTVLPPVEVVGTTEKLPESGFEEYSPVEGGYGYEYRPELTTSNVSPVVTDVSTVDTVNTTPDSTTLDRVIVTGSTTPDTSNVSPVVTDLSPDTTTDTTVPAVDPVVEEPEKEKEPPKKTEKIYPTVTGVPPPKKLGRQPIITGASPARLLADALAAYRPSGSVEGVDSGKERQNVWNEKSLRLKDALGL